jgi:hypothetical protein
MAFARHPPVELICEQCGRHFTVPYWRTQSKGYVSKYCSRQCNMKSKIGMKRKPETILKSVETRRSNKTYADKILVSCDECGSNFLVVPSKIDVGKGKYCSRKCMGEFFKKHYRGTNSRNNLWKGGSSFGKYCFKFNNVFKDNVSNHFGNKCILCEKLQSENIMKSGKIHRLCIHHVYTEKMACCESKIVEMDTLRKRFPKSIAMFGEPEFSEEEIKYIRMLVPLCKSCHGKMINEESDDIPYDESHHRKLFTDIINSKYSGRCYD